MINLCASSSSLLNTPFTNQRGKAYFVSQGIQLTQAKDADLIVSGTFKKLFAYMLRFGWSKKYLLWTLEPRFSKHFQSRISNYLLPSFHVMNVYTGNFDNNYFFVPRQSRISEFEKISQFKTKKIVSLMTFQAGSEWTFLNDGIDLDLCNLRTQIAFEGRSREILDIYGKNWPDGISLEISRGEGWRARKLEILSQYHFNLCFENTNWPYYCTEKIWDAILGGCLPIYYGKGNRIYDDFPKKSFLDYCDFEDVDTLLNYVQAMDTDEFNIRMHRCVQAYERAIQRRRDDQPHQRLLHRTLTKIREICDE